MRSLFLDKIELIEEAQFEVSGPDAHHLINVLRVKPENEILLLNGNGIKAFSKVESVGKKSVNLKINRIVQCEKSQSPALGLCVPKKDYLETALRIAIELGVSEIYLFESEYSQRYELNPIRIDKILKSAYEQSNNPFCLNIIEAGKLSEIEQLPFKNIYFFNSQSNQASECPDKTKIISSDLILIGPEGGFSATEIEILRGFNGINEVCLNSKPIMRSVTAIPFAFGYLMH